MKKIQIAILILICLNSSVSYSQSAICDANNLDRSRDRYEIGDFLTVRRNLETCIRMRGFMSLDELNKARELLALTEIAEDRLEEAEILIVEIVKSNNKFVPNYRNIVFNLMFEQAKRDNIGVSVTSVSKRAEDLNSAPATVKIITREEIIDRGYLDLVDILSDMPGFDISKIFSVTYANIFQMGFRQENTERTLFMVDGVEENDLWLNWAYISRQYPLSNIKAVEILYGPSSTMYGPRAFVGAINVITLSPKEIPEDSMGSKQGSRNKFYLDGNTQVGNFNTQVADLTLGLRGKVAALQVTGRYYRSDEHDLSDAEFYNYSPNDIDHFTYDHMNLVGSAGPFSLNQYMDHFNLPMSHTYYTVNTNASGDIEKILLTPEGIERARELDRLTYTGNANGHPIGFSNHTEDYFIGAKLTVENFLFGVRHWKRTEGFNFYQDIDVAGSKNGSVWSPENTTIYAQYDKEITDKLSISNLANFALHQLGRASNRVNFISFGNPRGDLHLAHLLQPETLLPSIRNMGTSQNLYGTEFQELNTHSLVRNGWRNRYYFYEAQQFRNEFRVFYDSEKVKMSNGIDFRSTLTQGDYLIYMDFDTDHPNRRSYRNKQSSIALAREKGIVENQAEGSNMFSIIDIGIFNQITVNLNENFLLSGGNRVDYNQIRRSGGYGFAFSPRFSAIYNSPHTTFKLNYSRGLQNVSQWTKYSTGGGRKPNPDLSTESINFVNLEYLGRIGNGNLSWDINGFFYEINDAVSSGSIDGIRKNYNAGQYRSVGIMSGLHFTSNSKNWHLNINQTYNRPQQISSTVTEINEPLRLGDIAAHRVNFSITRKNKIGGLHNVINLRANYVSERPIGPGTTQNENIGVNGSGEIPAYLLINSNIGFKLESIPYLRLDLRIENLLDNNILDALHQSYFHPGPRSARGRFNMPGDLPGRRFGDDNVPYVPQRPRFFMVRLTYML